MNYTAGRIALDALTFGGHGGGPVWRFDGTNHKLQGLISTTDRTGSTEATRLNNDDFNDISSLIC